TGRDVELRVVSVAPGEPVLFGLKAVDAREPLRPIIDGGQHIRGRRKLYRSTINAGLRINPQGHAERNRCAPQIPQSSEVKVEPRVVWAHRTQVRDRIRGGKLHREIGGGMQIMLLKRGKEKCLVLAHGTTRGESENIVAENRLRNTMQPVEVGNRGKALRLV